MDTLKKLPQLILRYKYAVLVLLLGIALMLLPTKKSETAEPTMEAATQANISAELGQILSQVQGVGEVRVMLTVAAGESTLYKEDGDGNIVIITGADRGESALAEQVNGPKYRGAIVVCQGADSPSVRLAVVEAVSKVTGLATDRISVLKMK